jgi:hypothetical protein
MKTYLVAVLFLCLAVLACGPSQTLVKTPAAPSQTQPPAQTRPPATPTITHLNFPTDSPTPGARDTATPKPTDQSTSADTPVPADTAVPTDAVLPTDTAMPVTDTPAPTATPTKKPTARPGSGGGTTQASFLQTVTAVKGQLENFGGQIDIAVHSGSLDCTQTVNSYEFVASHATIANVPASLAGAYQLYTQGLGIFLPKAADLYTNCKNFLANPSGGGIPAQQWTVARTAVNDADQLLRQAIIAAGGTP